MKAKWLNKIRKNKVWFWAGALPCIVMAVLFLSFYGLFRNCACQEEMNPFIANTNVSWLYSNTYLLYKELYNSQNQIPAEYFDLYILPKEGYEWINDLEITEETIINDKSFQKYTAIQKETMLGILSDRNNLEGYFESLNNQFRDLNEIYDYVIEDSVTKKYLTNMTKDQMKEASNSFFFYVQFTFDDRGNASVENVFCHENEEMTLLRKSANEAIHENYLISLISSMEYFPKQIQMQCPKNCTVTYCITHEMMDKLQHEADSDFRTNISDYSYLNLNYSLNEAIKIQELCTPIILILFFLLFLIGLFYPIHREKNMEKEIRKYPVGPEILLLAIVISTGYGGKLISALTGYIASGQAVAEWSGFSGKSENLIAILSILFNFILLFLVFFLYWYYGMLCTRIRILGVKQYLLEKSILVSGYRRIRDAMVQSYRRFESIDLTENSRKLILRVVLINAVIMSLISVLWYGGMVVCIIYSIVIYFLLRKYINGIQKKYQRLLDATNAMAEGDLNVKIEEDLGVFESFKPELMKIQNGFKAAVDEEVKSQRLKGELITNVSHDLKTPLTAIITYINLLKDENTSVNKRKEYLNILDHKALRLKGLIEDLFEISKANSNNMTWNLNKVDIMNLVKQVSFELSDSFKESELELRMYLTDEKIILTLDSQKTYRIFENLFVNISKYAMKGTRVYVNGFRLEDEVIITLKNISSEELTMNVSDLTERFVRGDRSRNTEGSGLGLAIAKSFTELQGGHLKLDVDGDLFKVTLTWKIPEDPDIMAK